ncbi:MAG: DUF29 domain-containing protein [Thermosynechococcaceae cyanobacterium]
MTSTQIRSTSHPMLYDTDFVEWIDEAVTLLKQGKFSELDVANLIEEVEDLGKRDKRAAYSNLKVVLLHLLKWQFQSDKRSASWHSSIQEHRQCIQQILKDSPSLKNYLKQEYRNCYNDARELASIETRLPLNTFPAECPYAVEQAQDSEFLPE